MILDQEKIETAAVAMLLAAGVEGSRGDILSDDRYVKQVTAFVLALAKNVEREATYDGLWEKYGLKTCASNAQSKAIRLEHHSEWRAGDSNRQHDDAMDDALDLINYGAFCARLIDVSAKEHGLQPSS